MSETILENHQMKEVSDQITPNALVDSNIEHIPEGNYTLVSVDVDTTGRRLIDEIVHLTAYTPNDQFGQYIMPIMNLNPAARQRHQIRVITVGFFRMLKNMQTYKVVKTKTEIAALKDFLCWLEKLNETKSESSGIIMIYHEQRKFIPYMILESLTKYGLLQRFFCTVKGFCDGFALSEAKMGISIKYLSLKQISKVLHNFEEETEKDKDNNDFEGNAIVRARLAYQIIEHLSVKGMTDVNTEVKTEKMLELVTASASPISREFAALRDQNKCMDRQNSLRPIFVNYFKVTLYHRVKAVTFRRIIADHGYDLEQLHEVWESKKKDGLNEVIASMEEVKPDDKIELVDLLDSHFDPDKQAILPIVKKHRSKRGLKENIRPQNGDTSPDSTNKTLTKSASRRRRTSSNKTDNFEQRLISDCGVTAVVSVPITPQVSNGVVVESNNP